MMRTAALLWLLCTSVEAFLTPQSRRLQRALRSVSSQVDEAAKLKAEAERVRLEAEQLDASLTLQKISSIESKLKNVHWLEKHPEQREILREQLENLQRKVRGEAPLPRRAPKEEVVTITANPSPSTVTEKTKAETTEKVENPLSGFDDEDLAIYLPVATEIEERMSNATETEKLVAFRSAPELQEHFRMKIHEMLVEPMREMQELEKLKQEYLSSSSSTEKAQLKRQMEQLETTLERDGPFGYSDSVNIDIDPMSDDELAKRVAAVSELPGILQSLYKARTGAGEDASLELTILMDHYEPQLQLLEQVKLLDSEDEEIRMETRLAIDSLPPLVREHFAKKLEAEENADTDTLMELLFKAEGMLGPVKEIVIAANDNMGEYNDIDFVDRTRYLAEFYPDVTRLEEEVPSLEQVEQFVNNVIDRKKFMVTSKPERVMGGYYIRGTSQIDGDDSAEKLVSMFEERLASSPLKDDLDFFFVPDPSPATDEQFEMGEGNPPVLILTTKNRDLLYETASPALKIAITALGLAAAAIISLGAIEMQPALFERVEAAIDAGDQDIAWISDIAGPIAYSLLGTQLVHDAAHKVVAVRDRFDTGTPNLIPSIQLGLLGTITPLRSPPPDLKSMFDFAMAGPLSGIVVSLGLLVTGLEMTSTTSPADLAFLPAFPAFMLKASALGGGLVEFFLGTGSVSNALPDAAITLHPFAIAGFAGLVANALALLPLGNTDGGRVSLAMFGRRGSYLVSIFSTVLLCAAGLVGLDESHILLSYILFVVLWQRLPETPARNEVAQLDVARGVAAFGTAVIVALTLLPMM